MNPVLKYTLGRLAILVACAVPAVFLLTSVDLLVRLMIALVVSAVISYVALRRWRDEVSERIAANARRRSDDRARLRSVLAGDSASAGSATSDAAPRPSQGGGGAEGRSGDRAGDGATTGERADEG